MIHYRYFNNKFAPEKMYRFRPHVKLILVLRDPVDRLLLNCHEVIRAHKRKKFPHEKWNTISPATWAEVKPFLFKDEIPSLETLIKGISVKASNYQE